ncbi:hypothetical protein L1987_13600 [Smallanthus sonchifolius]|uniref:Uncharacterized protein n=1 Tax=Smallanthus sonchifolius TaxID=185202 RepID=A0ACB9JI05_9ASTR|nr:hypothetical protein L1987_13600 [Smallanthus sonchifolius]
MNKACRYSPDEKKERIERYRCKKTQRPIIPALGAPSTSQSRDLSFLQDNGSGDAVIYQAMVDNSTTASIDQMPIINPLIIVTEEDSSSHEAEAIPDLHLSNLLVHTEVHSDPHSRILIVGNTLSVAWNSWRQSVHSVLRLNYQASDPYHADDAAVKEGFIQIGYEGDLRKKELKKSQMSREWRFITHIFADVLAGVSNEDVDNKDVAEDVEQPELVEEEDVDADDHDDGGNGDVSDAGGDNHGNSDVGGDDHDDGDTGGDGGTGVNDGGEAGGEASREAAGGGDGGKIGGDGDDGGDKFEKDGMNEKIEYETVDRMNVETDFSLDRSKWLKPLPPVPEPLVQKSGVKKTEDISKIISSILIRCHCDEGFTTFKTAKTIRCKSMKVIDPPTSKGNVTIHLKPTDVIHKVKIPLKLSVLHTNFVK